MSVVALCCSAGVDCVTPRFDCVTLTVLALTTRLRRAVVLLLSVDLSGLDDRDATISVRRGGGTGK